MRIGIVSDTHNRYPTVELALGRLKAHGIERIIHCGDIEDIATVEMFQGLQADFVFGNCDDDRDGLREAMRRIGATLHEPFGDLEIAGRKIAFIHSDNKRLFQDIERSGHFDFLFYGHTHLAEQHQTGPTRVVNPGALQRARPKTCVVLDLPSGVLETITVEGES